MAGFYIPSFGRWPRDRCKIRSGWLAALLAAGLLAGYPGTGFAQTVQGQLLDAATGSPVEGALILLFNHEGEESGGYLTNQAGRFILRAPAPGTYSLRAERIGYATTTSDSFTLAPSQQFGIRLETSQTAVELEGIRVEGDQRCVVRPEEGLQLASVWEEARKALTVQNWTERAGLYRFQITRYERDLDPSARLVQAERSEVHRDVTGSPIRSLPAEDLLSNGFVRRDSSGGYDYLGPDASVLLSEQFLDTHCFTLTPDTEGTGAFGLSFEPVRPGSMADIAGTLWLDSETAGLRYLEYSYTWAPWEEAHGVGRGRVEFENLPNGAWVIRQWWIRMPIVATNFSVPATNSARIRLIAVREVGGEITRYSSLDRSVVSVTPRGILEGQVWDSIRQTPLAGATVFLSGTHHAAEADSSGAFSLTDLPGGVFSAVFTHPRLDSMGVFSTPVEVEIVPGEFTAVSLGTPSMPTIFSSICTQEELTDRTGAVVGLVEEGQYGSAIEGASVSVTWSIFEDTSGGRIRERRQGLQTTTDAAGRYSVCGVPLDARLTVQATDRNQDSMPVEAHAADNGYTVINLIIGTEGP